MELKTIIYEVRDHAAWITLNRPDALNAINANLIEDLRQALNTAENDEMVRVLVLTGAGKAFCAGADLKTVFGSLDKEGTDGLRKFVSEASAFFKTFAFTKKPIIGAVNGIAAAGGLELLLCCDLIIAAESAKIGDAHANFGLLPGGGSSARLPRKIGPNRAKQLLLTGEFLPVTTLMEWGLVNEVVPDADLTPAVEKIVAKLTAKSPLVLNRMKRLVEDGLDSSLNVALNAEMGAWEAHSGAEDLSEGLKAFVEKRDPVYNGR